MAKKKKEKLYPTDYKPENIQPEQEPDMIPGTVTPNYDKFEGWKPEEVLAWLNID